MKLEQISALGRKLTLFLSLFAECFGRRDARALLRVYVQGQLSNLHRKTAEAIALEFKTAPRTLRRFLESIKWYGNYSAAIMPAGSLGGWRKVDWRPARML